MKKRKKKSTASDWLGLRELTQYAAVSERTIRKWIHSAVDPLPAVRRGGKLFVRLCEFEAWFTSGRVMPQDKRLP